jgi:hypothetical protein
VTITTPTSASTYTTAGSPLNLGGTATDAVGVTQVTWTNDRGGSGSASFTPGASVNWTINGIALLNGQNVITVTAQDAAGNPGTDTLTVTYTPPLPAVTFSGMQSGAQSKAVLTAALSLATGYPSSVTGNLELSFVANADNPIDDPDIKFTTGAKSVGFTIAANSTQAVFNPPSQAQFAAGTVAGAITLAAKFFTGGVEITPSPAPTWTIQVSRQVPYIEVSSVKIANRTSSSFDVELTGYSNSRELTQARFDFSGSNLQTTTLTVPLTSNATTWYQGATSALTGSSFKYTQSFTATQGSAANVTSVSVVLTNKQGDSAARSGN